MTTIEKAREIQNESEGYILMSRSGAVLWAAKQMAEWKDKKYQELLEKSIEWFNNIAESCSKLTSGNVSHLGTTIRGKAIRAAEFIEKHKNIISNEN